MKCQRPDCLNEAKIKYCSRSCAAIVNNSKIPKRKPQGKCKTCEIPISTSLVYCSKECHPVHSEEIYSVHTHRAPKSCSMCHKPVANSGKCREHYNEHMALYMLKRYHRRRSDFIERRGGRCEQCASTDSLEIDHLNPDEKSFNLAKALSGWAEARVQEELVKCQVICKSCHLEKTRKDLALRFRQREHWEHGTVTGRKHCDCDPCKKAKAEYMKQWRERKKQAGSA